MLSIFLYLLLGAILVEGTIALTSYLVAGKKGFWNTFKLINTWLLLSVLFLAGATLVMYLLMFGI